MIDPALLERLRSVAFDGAAIARGAVFVVLDGAMVERLPARLAVSGCEYSCLFSGALDPMLEEAAPHLVHLRADDPFGETVLRQGWNDHWGIVLHAGPGMGLYEVRQHLRRHLRVLDAEGHAMFFRFYDPRVFRLVVPQLDRQARRDFFGPIRRFVVEDERPDAVLCFESNGALQGSAVALSPATLDTA